MSDEKRYQGWTNYETWCVNLWIDNERESYERWRAEARSVLRRAPTMEQVTQWNWSKQQAAREALALAIREAVEDAAPALSGVYGDLLTSALSEVNWSEVADEIIAEVEPDELPQHDE